MAGANCAFVWKTSKPKLSILSKQQQHIDQLLHRWIDGDVTRREEQRLEQLAQDDPFLAEALQGYRHFADSPHRERLDDIQTVLKKKYPATDSGASFSISPRLAVAATVLLLIVAAFWLLMPNTPDTITEANQTVTEEASSEEALKPVENSIPDDQAGEVGTLADGREDTEEDTGLPIDPEEVENATPPPATPPPPAVNEQIAARDRSTDTISLLAEQESAPADNLSRTLPSVVEPTTLSATSTQRKINGQVIAPSGTPMSGVRIKAAGTTAQTITNQQGEYELTFDASVKSLEVQSANRPAERIPIPEGQQYIRITLDAPVAQPSSSVAEQADDAAKKQKPAPSASGTALTGELAEPIGGFKRFERYINRNLRYPNAALEQQVSGSVVLSFIVQDNGSVTAVQVISGPGAGLHEEAIRLLIEGPRWKINDKEMERAQVRYRINFSF